MYSDIEVNLESIIHTVDQMPYRQIMGQYGKRMQVVTSSASRLEHD